MATVDLVYDPDCPNIPAARANLLRAFSRAGVEPKWFEHRIGDCDAPERTRGYGSPTVLVDGRDVAGLDPSAEASCRIYAIAAGNTHAPSVDQIAQAISAAAKPGRNRRPGHSGWRSSLAMVPGIGVALLPKVACPACWPAYAGVLSSLGLGFLMESRWLLPLTAVFLAVAIGALAFRAGRRRGFLPFFVGLGGATIVLAGKFGFESDSAMYAGLGVLVGASVWNSWPRRAGPACSACITP
jgi:mercuric ion transport protein